MTFREARLSASRTFGSCRLDAQRTPIATPRVPWRVLLYNGRMDHIGNRLRVSIQKARETERGELMRYFAERLNATRLADGYGKITMPRMGKIFEKIPTKDLYYLKSVCDRAPHFSKRFWWEMNPENHTPENRSKFGNQDRYPTARAPKL